MVPTFDDNTSRHSHAVVSQLADACSFKHGWTSIAPNREWGRKGASEQKKKTQRLYLARAVPPSLLRAPGACTSTHDFFRGRGGDALRAIVRGGVASGLLQSHLDAVVHAADNLGRTSLDQTAQP